MTSDEHLTRLARTHVDYVHVVDRGARRYYFSDHALMRITLLNHPNYDERRRVEHDREVKFLGHPPPGFDAPQLIAHGEDAEVLWLARGIHRGPLLSELIKSGAAFDSDRIIGQVLGQLVILEQRGLYHDDLRGHNVVVENGGHARLIDFGSISTEPSDCLYPHDLLLCFLNFVREVTGRIDLDELPHVATGRSRLLDIASLPHLYRTAFERLLTQPHATWSFQRLQPLIDTPASSTGSFVPWPAGIHLLLAKLHGGIVDHQADIQRANAEIGHLKAEAERLTALVTHTNAQATGLRKEIADLAADNTRLETEAATNRQRNAALEHDLAASQEAIARTEALAARQAATINAYAAESLLASLRRQVRRLGMRAAMWLRLR